MFVFRQITNNITNKREFDIRIKIIYLNISNIAIKVVNL